MAGEARKMKALLVVRTIPMPPARETRRGVTEDPQRRLQDDPPPLG
jgi:hypothetical protein